ncbi:hypothetical protein HYALB_00012636 [Hymenoscyphus albidus]|uniref:Major facilitator superfamily (MFS) profile domain-containing protein n=1 Tax=Hymenoscyphus albidus TaxID=595503 RepID=A0A9N9LUJ4_9HELO|nr:hypothetical protein HYALB_00012636 [Hymenoscyphus albidus]
MDTMPMLAFESQEAELKEILEGSGEEHRLTQGNGERREVEDRATWQMVKRYRASVMWSAFVGMAGINWGMDVLLSNGIISVPAFQRDYGYMFENSYIISASWQIAFNTAASIGGFFGAIGSGYVVNKWGTKLTLAVACMVSIAAVYLQTFTMDMGLLMVGKLINGATLGAFLTITSSYAAEVCPVEVRGLTTSGVQLFIGIGQLSANLIIKATGTMESDLAYKIPFSLQFIFPVLLLIGLPFCPESPWFLARSNQNAKAISTLARLGHLSPEQSLAEIALIINHERQKLSSTSYLDCFKGSDLRRSEIAMGIFSVAQLTGVGFVVGYSSYFFELAGLSASHAFSLSVGVTVLGLVGVVCSWFLINRAGRRPTSLYGTAFLSLLLFLIGILDVIPGHHERSVIYGQVTCIILFAFVYLMTIGPMGWTLFAEISSPRLRSRTVGLGIVVQNSFGVLMNIIVPLLISPDAANLRGKIGFIFGVTSGMSVYWIWARVPETAGRRFEELNWLFEKDIPARKFKDYDVLI